MAKAGKPSRVAQEGDGRSSATKRVLVEAAIESLKTQGFSGASARAIATRAGCNQALVFYHFGSVVNLLLAALDAVSADRLAHYSAALGGVSSPAELVEVASAIFREDLHAGYATVLVEMIAGASSTPGLGAEVAARIAPWTDFARSAIEVALGQSALRAMIPSVEVAHGVVAFYLGLELLTHLDGDRAASLALFARTRQLVTILGVLGTQFPTTSPTTSATATPQEEHTP